MKISDLKKNITCEIVKHVQLKEMEKHSKGDMGLYHTGHIFAYKSVLNDLIRFFPDEQIDNLIKKTMAPPTEQKEGR